MTKVSNAFRTLPPTNLLIMSLIRTPEKCFDVIDDFPYAPHYFDHHGARVHYIDEGQGEIFKWYAEDFTKDGRSVISYINRFRGAGIPPDFTVSYYEYDWKLNEQ